MRTAAVREVGHGAFDFCSRLRTVYVWEGCPDVQKLVRSPAQVVQIPSGITDVGGRLLRDLRAAREVVLPDGLREVGAGWFARSGVRFVCVPKSVERIAEDAFRGCRWLAEVEFARGSRLEVLGRGCFRESGLVWIQTPGRLR